MTRTVRMFLLFLSNSLTLMNIHHNIYRNIYHNIYTVITHSQGPVVRREISRKEQEFDRRFTGGSKCYILIFSFFMYWL